MPQWILRLVLVAAMAIVGFAASRLAVPARLPSAVPITVARTLSAQAQVVAEVEAAFARSPGQAIIHLGYGDGSLAVHLADVARGERFDVIVLSDVLDSLLDPMPLLRAVGAALVPGTGRLVLVQPRLEERFVAGDFDAAFGSAWQEGATSASPTTALQALRAAVWQRLRPTTRAVLAAALAADLPNDVRDALAADFNVMLDDRSLVPAINTALGASGSGVAQALTRCLSLADTTVLQWLVLNFDDQGIFEPSGPLLSPVAQAALHTVNALSLAPLFRPEGRMQAGVAAAGLFLSEAGLVRRLLRAGYRRVASPIEPVQALVLVFVRDAQAGARPW